MHPLQGSSLRKSFVSLPWYIKGNTSVMCYPPAAPVHPCNRIAVYQAKKVLVYKMQIHMQPYIFIDRYMDRYT